MFNYRGIVQGRVEKVGNVKIIDDTYNVVVPAVSSEEIQAKALSQPRAYALYNKGDHVLVSQIDTTGDYIILGLIQKREVDKTNTPPPAQVITNQYYTTRTTQTAAQQGTRISVTKQLFVDQWLQDVENERCYYQLDMSGYGVVSESYIDVIPSLDSTDAVLEIGVYPYVGVFTDCIVIYARFLPTQDITVLVGVVN